MEVNTYLIVKPYIPELEFAQLNEQGRCVKAILRAVREANLTIFDNEDPSGCAINAKSDMRLIRAICEATIVIFDANLYGSAALSPLLSYLIGLRHTRNNQNLIVAKSIEHLPIDWRQQRALAYGEDVGEFQDQLVKEIAAIQSDNQWTDNPIQAYLGRKAQKEQLEIERAEVRKKEAEIKRITQNKPERIQFHKVT